MTQDAQQADEQQPAEQPGAIHGAEEEVKEEEVEEAASQEWRSRGSQQVHRRFSLHPPDLLALIPTHEAPPERRGDGAAAGGTCGRVSAVCGDVRLQVAAGQTQFL